MTIEGGPPVVAAVEVGRDYPSGGNVVSAVRSVSLEVARGAFVALMGPSGSGKSTLLHLLAGLDRPTRGSVTVDGQPIASLDERALTKLRREKIGVVFQAFNLVDVLTALQNVALPLMLAGVQKAEAGERAVEALEGVGLQHLAGRRPSSMSGGEQQRVAIARAIAQKPSVIFADEPTGSLDSENSDLVVDLLRRAHREFGQTIMVATHDPRVAASADEVIRLHDGVVTGALNLGTRRRRSSAATKSVLSWLNEPASAGATP